MNKGLTFGLICLVTLLFAAWFGGCGEAKVVHVRTDPNFTYEAASSSTISIAGVVTAIGDEDYQKEVGNKLPLLLATRIAKKRPDLSITDPQRIEKALGKERLRELLDRYGQSGRLDTASVIALFEASRGLARYVILARIYMDSTARVINEDEFSIDHKTERMIKIVFNVYDISTATLVFDESISHEDFNLQLDAKHEAPDDDCSSALSFVACILDIFSFLEDKDDEGFPPPPELEDMAKVIFDQFAATLPAASSG